MNDDILARVLAADGAPQRDTHFEFAVKRRIEQVNWRRAVVLAFIRGAALGLTIASVIAALAELAPQPTAADKALTVMLTFLVSLFAIRMLVVRGWSIPRLLANQR